jgi:hypothetical protein
MTENDYVAKRDQQILFQCTSQTKILHATHLSKRDKMYIHPAVITIRDRKKLFVCLFVCYLTTLSG